MDMVGVRVCGSTLFIDPVVLDINSIVNYITFEKAKGKEGLLHWVIHHVTSFIEPEVYVQFSDKSLCKHAISSEGGRGVSQESSSISLCCRGYRACLGCGWGGLLLGDSGKSDRSLWSYLCHDCEMDTSGGLFDRSVWGI